MSCNEAQRKQPEATIVTTLQVTHILPGCTAEEATRIAEVIAEAAAESLACGYRDGVLPQGQPDNITVGGVQIFSKEETAE